MDVTANVFRASLAGNVELLTVCGAGALLSYLGYWSTEISNAMSNGVYRIFLPALVFVSALDTVHNAVNNAEFGVNLSASQELWIPIVFSVFIYLFTMLIAYPLTKLVARRKDECTQRTMFMCMVLGNSNAMVLIIMQSLCDSFPALRANEKCFIRATAYGSLYIMFTTVLAFSIIFPFVLSAGLRLQKEESQALLGDTCPSTTRFDKRNTMSWVIESLLSPPTLTVIIASIMACIPKLAEAFLEENGIFRSLFQSLAAIGSVAVPLGTMIVGGDLYFTLSSFEMLTRRQEVTILSSSRHRRPLTAEEGSGIGWIYGQLNLRNYIVSNELGVFILTEFGVVTANNAMIITNIMAGFLPERGDTMRRDVAKCLFLQYATATVFVTLNTALSLRLQYGA